MNSTEKILTYLNQNNIINVYQFGSRVYGSHHSTSDYDYIVIADEWFDAEDINIHVYTVAQFELALNNADIQVLECVFAPEQFKLKHKLHFYFILDKSKLRRSISTITSNSWVKGKKKLTVAGDYDVNLAIKSVFHSIRILDFGIQIATEGKIVNYSSSNYILEDLWKLSTSYQRDELWQQIDAKYRKMFNSQSSTFKSLAPKDLNFTHQIDDEDQHWDLLESELYTIINLEDNSSIRSFLNKFKLKYSLQLK